MTSIDFQINQGLGPAACRRLEYATTWKRAQLKCIGHKDTVVVPDTSARSLPHLLVFIFQNLNLKLVFVSTLIREFNKIKRKKEGFKNKTPP